MIQIANLFFTFVSHHSHTRLSAEQGVLAISAATLLDMASVWSAITQSLGATQQIQGSI